MTFKGGMLCAVKCFFLLTALKPGVGGLATGTPLQKQWQARETSTPMNLRNFFDPEHRNCRYAQSIMAISPAYSDTQPARQPACRITNAAFTAYLTS
jgi:hypothetical protein